MQFEPTYLKLLRFGDLKEQVKEAYKRLGACDICPRECGVDRKEEWVDGGQGLGQWGLFARAFL